VTLPYPHDSFPAGLAPPTIPDLPSTFRYLDPAAILAFRTPLQEHPPAADTKAAGILSAFGIMFALLSSYERGIVARELETPGIYRVIVLLFLVGFALVSCGAIVQAIRTIFPRFPASTPSLAYFGDIARMTREEYIDRVMNLSHEQALEAILVYNHNVSAICIEKFGHLKRGVRLLRIAFLWWLALLFVINFRAIH
jgi:hypothetical protein